MNKQGTILAVIAIGFLLFLVNRFGYSEGTKQAADLEIYTSENIYFINGLTVTTETDDRVITFDDMQSLKAYIGNETADDSSNRN